MPRIGTEQCWLRTVGALVALLCFAFSLTTPLFAQQAVFGPGLEAALGALGAGEELTIVVTFEGDGPISQERIGAVEALGITKGFAFQALPVMGVRATAQQAYDLALLEGVRSVWRNEELTYFNRDATALTGVDRLRTDSRLRTSTGAPFSGRGIGVVVHDSGIDGTLPDLEFGENLVQNVQGLTNPEAYGNEVDDVTDEAANASALTPIVYTEDQINTDISSGHGTHVAGTVGGRGVSSNGIHEGVAPGADLIGYGSGAVLLILDALGGFDYAITHQFDRDHDPIRVITNSWGSSGAFQPDNPINVASYAAYQRGITVLFAAGNSGPIEDTHNPYAVAPWVISVAAGDKSGNLAGFSSRGMRNDTGTFQTADGETWTYVNRPTVTAPGVDIISSRATTGALPLLAADADVAELGGNAAFYTIMSGTSMATPHVAGIVALMLEANPQLQPDDVKAILEETATNMPGREPWEVGAGYANAYAAVVNALGRRTDFGATLSATRDFNSTVDLRIERSPFAVDYNPRPELSADGNTTTFDVPEGLALLWVVFDAEGIAGETGNAIYPVLISPDGTEYASGTTLLFAIDYVRSEAVPSPMPGTWTLEVRGIQSGTGNNVVSVPEMVEGTIVFEISEGYTGLNDIAGHPAEGAIQAAVGEMLLDGFADGTFRPGDALTRGQLAEYLVLGAAVRQHLPINGSASFADVAPEAAPFVEAVTNKGAALKDVFHRFQGVMRADGGAFKPNGAVDRAHLAYSLVQALGLQEAAQGFSGEVTAPFKDQRVAVTDSGQIPADLRGYVQLAIDLGLLHATFHLAQGPYDLEPTVTATFHPAQVVQRGEYAVAATRFFTRF